MSVRRSIFIIFMFAVLVFLTSCGGSGNNPSQYTIGGTISGLMGSGLVLQDNGGNDLSVSAGANGFTFTTAIAAGSSYNVAIVSQPSSPFQYCEVTNGVGLATSANVTSVGVTCTTITTFYTIGGTVSGLLGAGGGLVLQDNNGDNLLVNGNGSFTFPTAVPSGGNYSVTILAQPSSPPQICLVSDGNGTASAAVISIVVQCANSSWSWLKGSNSINQIGVYGSPGTAADANTPGARQAAVTWIDTSGNLWLFGGYGYDAAGTLEPLNDLWKFSISTSQWTWMGGSNLAGQSGTYGLSGVPSQGNIPGARFEAVGWTDSSGNFWLFGGNGFDSVGTEAPLNDLWKYSAGQWTWISGSKFANQAGSYGTLGVSSSSNVPGARDSAVAGVDPGGNFWLFGGIGYDSSGSLVGELNDLWKYNGSQWTWVSGSSTINQFSVYGTMGVPAAANVPGARIPAAGWADRSGSFWVFGGVESSGAFNDLWKFDGNQWTWESGSDYPYVGSDYGTQGVPSPNNVPSSRQLSASWTDSSGDLWLFGGNGIATGLTGWLNDLWEYRGGQWIWVSGSKTVNSPGLYGTHGVPGPGNVPAGRFNVTRWIDANDNLWLFGGYGQIGQNGDLNDLWKYTTR